MNLSSDDFLSCVSYFVLKQELENAVAEDSQIYSNLDDITILQNVLQRRHRYVKLHVLFLDLIHLPWVLDSVEVRSSYPHLVRI